MKLLKYWKPIVIAIVIFYGSISSNENLNKVSILNFNNSDKILHFLLYLLLSITLQMSILRNTLINRKNLIILSFVVVVSYGLIMEVFQFYFTKNRSAEVIDAIANTLGCVFGILILPVLQKITLSKYL